MQFSSEICTNLVHDLPVVLIMLFGVAVAKMLGVLPAVSPAEVVLLLLPTVLTARLPGEIFFTGTTTLLQDRHTHTLYFIQTGIIKQLTC